MKERGILMNAEMVNATLDDRKTQTRRIVKVKGGELCGWDFYKMMLNMKTLKNTALFCTKHSPFPLFIDYPYGKVGDQLYVRETTEIDEDTSDIVTLSKYSADGKPVLYSMCDDPEYNGSVAHWDYSRNVRPSIHMKRWASRIQLEITDIRVERLNDISEEDVRKEGCEIREMWMFGADKNGRDKIARIIFKTLWESINGKGSWDKNPWVWCVSFKKL